MDKKNRLLQLIGHYSDGNKAKFAAKIGVKPQTISMWLARDTLDYDLIFTTCEYISAEWLITGEGEMIKHSRETKAPADAVTTEHADKAPAAPSNSYTNGHLLDIIRQQAEEIGRLKERLHTLQTTNKAYENSPPNTT